MCMAKPKALARLEGSNICQDAGLLRTEVRGDFNQRPDQYKMKILVFSIFCYYPKHFHTLIKNRSQG